MNTRKASGELKSLARLRVHASGVDWAELETRSRQIIVFGSFALSASTSSSDFDLLCVGEGERIRTRELHIIWIPETRLQDSRWLASELATHVAAYGHWIKGENTWAYRSAPGEEALCRKHQRIREHTSALLRHWPDLGECFKLQHLRRIRRDFQRYAMMKSGDAPVPKLFLDEAWIESNQFDAWATLALKASELIPEMSVVLRLIRDLNQEEHI